MSTGYYAGSRDTAQANMDAAAAEAEKNKKDKFNLGDFIGGLLGIGNQDGDNNTGSSTGGGLKTGYGSTEADNAREQARDPNNANGGSGATGGGGGGGFQGGANPSGQGQYGGR